MRAFPDEPVVFGAALGELAKLPLAHQVVGPDRLIADLAPSHGHPLAHPRDHPPVPVQYAHLAPARVQPEERRPQGTLPGYPRRARGNFFSNLGSGSIRRQPLSERLCVPREIDSGTAPEGFLRVGKTAACLHLSCPNFGVQEQPYRPGAFLADVVPVQPE
jgi:hypothetical protein